MKNRAAALLALLLLLTLFTGCNNSSPDINSISDVDAEVEEARRYNFIFVCPILDNEYWQTCIEGINEADAELGTTTKVIGPPDFEGFAVKIIDFMKEAIAEKPDGIIVYSGVEGLYPLIDEASEAGIPVLSIDSDAPETKRIAYVGSDDYVLGYRAGEELVSLTGGTGVVATMVSSKSAERELAVMSAFAEAVSDFDIEIICAEETGGGMDAAEEKAREMLLEHPEITAIFSTGSYNVAGAARLKEKTGRDDLILIGYDDIEENLRFVRKGVINCIFAQQVEQMGYNSVSVLKEYIDRNGYIVNLKSPEIICITPENIDSVNVEDIRIDGSGKTVRVGYYSGITAFQDGFDDSSRKSGYAYEYLQDIATIAGWSYEYRYGTRAEMLELLKSGDVDIVAGVYKTDSTEEQFLLSQSDMGLDSEKRYFAVNKERTDIISELDGAMNLILQANPDYTLALKQRYYSYSSQQILTDNEKAWLEEKGEIRFGYVRNNLPISDIDENGEPTGLVSELISHLGSYMLVDMKPVCYDSISDMEQGLKRGEIDAAFPVYSDVWSNETKGLRQTDSVISERVMMVYKGKYTDNAINSVAINKEGISQTDYISMYYPNANILYCDNREETFRAVAEGKAQCAIGCSSVVQRFLLENADDYQNLNIAYLDVSEEYCIAVCQGVSLLAGIINKALKHLDTATVTSAIMRYSGVEVSYDFRDFVEQNALPFIGSMTIVFTLILVFFIGYIRKTREYNRQQASIQAALEDAAEAANAANKAKTSFLSSMSHDIRTPMNAICGMTTIGLQHINDKDRVRDCLEKISISGRHLLTLINDVLDISKIESGKIALVPSEFSLGDSFSNMVNIVKMQIDSKRLKFDVRTHCIEREMLYADEVRISQIYINILTNAVKYTPDGGKVSIDLIEELIPDNKARIIYIVEDTGIGMSEEFVKTAYESFSRAVDSRINKIQGTGLGLSIVKQMVDMMGGTIECRSELNKGTTFTVTLELPLAESGEKECKLPDIRILLIDDDDIFLEATGDMLRNMGAFVGIANGGPDGVEKAVSAHEKGRDYDVVIIGWKMQAMNGIETIKALKKAVDKDIPVVLTSSYEMEDMEDAAKAEGACGFMSKPLFPTAVCRTLKTVLQLDGAGEDQSHFNNDDLNGKHLLIAEDNDLNWEIIEELLSMYGITAERAENGKEAVEMLSSSREGKFDMILMDIQMPIMNGREATRQIRADSRTYINNIPIIAMTADAFAEDIAASIEAGMDGHVSKPVDMANLCQEMRKAMNQRGRG